MRVAFDIDDTITPCPEFFAIISEALMAGGHDVHIISYRRDREEAENELAGYGVKYREMHLPSDEDLNSVGFYEWKAQVCRRLRIDVFFEDMPEVINELDTSVKAFMLFDPALGNATYISEAEQT